MPGKAACVEGDLKVSLTCGSIVEHVVEAMDKQFRQEVQQSVCLNESHLEASYPFLLLLPSGLNNLFIILVYNWERLRLK